MSLPSRVARRHQCLIVAWCGGGAIGDLHAIFSFPLSSDRTRLSGAFSSAFHDFPPQQTFNCHYSFRCPSAYPIVLALSIMLGFCQSSWRCRLVHKTIAAPYKCSFGTQHILKLFIPYPGREESISLLPNCPLCNNYAVPIARLTVLPPFVTYCFPSHLLRLDFIGLIIADRAKVENKRNALYIVK